MAEPLREVALWEAFGSLGGGVALESGWVTRGPSLLSLYVLEMRWAALLCAVPTDLKQEDQIVIDRQVQKTVSQKSAFFPSLGCYQ